MGPLGGENWITAYRILIWDDFDFLSFDSLFFSDKNNLIVFFRGHTVCEWVNLKAKPVIFVSIVNFEKNFQP